MKQEIPNLLESLGVGLSRILRYSYGGFLLLIFTIIFEPHFIFRLMKHMSSTPVSCQA